MPKAVIFDMDGVLVDSGPAHHESWQVVARKHGLEISQATFVGTFGRPGRDIIRMLFNSPDAATATAIDEEKEAAYRDLVRGRVPFMPGCRAALETLHAAGFRVAVASSAPPENLALILDEGDLRPLLSATVHGFDIEHGKPAPDCFLLAAERMGVAPRDCVVVEDALVGVRAGVAAGMQVIGFLGGHPAEALREVGAAKIVARLDEVTPALVQALLAPRQ